MRGRMRARKWGTIKTKQGFVGYGAAGPLRAGGKCQVSREVSHLMVLGLMGASHNSVEHCRGGP